VGRRFLALALSLLVWSIPAAALADEWIFFDPHPVHPAAGGGFCEEPGAHVHDYAPVDPGAFALRDGLWFFVGDPVAYGYRGPVYRYEGSHEVPDSMGFAACPLTGVHYHLYPPGPIEVVAPVTAWGYGPAVGAPFWWDARRPRRAGPGRPHAFPVGPPPAVIRTPRTPPPAAMRRSPAGQGARRGRVVPLSPAPPPPARRR